MGTLQTFQCPECNEIVVYDPGTVIVSLNESKQSEAKQGQEAKEVVAYLTCLKGHTKPYIVKK